MVCCFDIVAVVSDNDGKPVLLVPPDKAVIHTLLIFPRFSLGLFLQIVIVSLQFQIEVREQLSEILCQFQRTAILTRKY
jgi:hypothetical protein